MPSVGRLSDFGCGAGLFFLVALKLIPGTAAPDVGIMTVAFVETALGASFVIGRTPRLNAGGLVLLGLSFCVWALLVGDEFPDGRPCGCFGPYRLKFVYHVVLAAGILLLGGIKAWTVDGRALAEKATRGSR